MKDKKLQQNMLLQWIVSEYLIYIDASVAQYEGFEKFIKKIRPVISGKGKLKIIMPKAEWDKLKESLKSTNGQTKELTKKSINLLNDLALQKIACTLPGKYQDSFFSLSREKSICFLTQKRDIAELFSKNPILKEFRAFQIRKLNCYGEFHTFDGSDLTMISNYQYRKNEMVWLANAPINVFRIPSEGSEVYVGTNRNKESLKKIVKYVSNGVIYDIGSELYVKIYNRDVLDIFHFEKCSLMTKKSVKSKSICWPLELVYDANNQFVGYTFSAYKGYPLHLAVMKKAGLDMHFPAWQKIDLVRMAITLLQEIEYLHWQNVMVACLDLSTIYIDSCDQVYLTELDEYQVDGYPCLVSNKTFTPPELLDYMDKIMLFNEKAENYVIAVLAFMLMLPGKFPYTQRWGGNSIRNIKNMEFPYAYKERHSRGVPSGFWRFIWSHLYYKLKKEFFVTFQKGEERNKPAYRHSTEFWINLLYEYYRSLESGEYCSIDANSELMFPSTFRKYEGEVYIKCKHCGKEFPEWFMDKEFGFFCKSCMNKPSDSYFTCKSCGRTFYQSIQAKMRFEIKGWKTPKICRECKKYKGIK